MSVFHSNTEMLIDYWRSLTFGSGPPPRGLLDPGEFAPLAPQVFLLGRERAGRYPFRLTGEFVRDLFGQDLRGRSLLSLFRYPDAWPLRTAMEAARRFPEPLVMLAQGTTASASIGLEILLAPLSGGTTGPDRFLGLLQPLSQVWVLQGEPVTEITLGGLTSAGGVRQVPRLKLAALDGRRIA
ncbi:MAG: PAS domain-containing protein [Phenylobacterium sp.]